MWFEGFRHSLFVNQIATFGNFNERSPSQKSNEFLGSKSFREMNVALTVISGELTVTCVSSNPTVPKWFRLKKYSLNKNALVSHFFLFCRYMKENYSSKNKWKKLFWSTIKVALHRLTVALQSAAAAAGDLRETMSHRFAIYWRRGHSNVPPVIINWIFDWIKSWSTTQLIGIFT